MIDAVKVLAKSGAILSIILGFLWILVNGLVIIEDLGGRHEPSIGDIMGFSLGLVAIILGFIILVTHMSLIESDPNKAALYFIILGVVAALGSYLVGGALVFVAGILLVVEQNRPT